MKLKQHYHLNGYGNFIVVIGLLLVGLHALKRLVPGPYRVVQQSGKRLVTLTVLGQAKKRGWLFVLAVHLPLLSALTFLLVGMMHESLHAVLAGLVLVSLALVAKRGLDSVRRLRARRRTMPGWR